MIYYSNMMHLSIIVPAYNEERRLPKTLKAIDDYLRSQDYDSEIVVVSDGSQDKTAQVSKELGILNLRVIENKENHGKGYVVRQGMLEAKGDFRVFMDADNSTTVNHVERMWPRFGEGSDVVICSRDHKDSVIPTPQSFSRRMLGDLFNVGVVQLIGGLWGMWDTQCGFKGFTAKAAQDIFSRSVIDRWAFDVEALVIAKKLGYRVTEVPVLWINDAESKVGVGLKPMIRVFREVAQIRWNSITGKYS